MKYSDATQRTIYYIEEHLQQELLLDDLVKAAGYSKFHLTRIFKHETGKSLSEYIRMRRLATAAMLLLHTDTPILEIAFELHFQSQEAFTRSFRELYAMPPGKYRKMMKSIYRMEGNEMVEQVEVNEVKGWIMSGSHPWKYRLAVDEKVFHSGRRSGLLQAVEEANGGEFGTMMQSFRAEEYKGKRLKMSCYLKSEKALSCAAWCRVDNAAGDPVQFDNMSNRAITGTTDWNYYVIVLDVPKESESIHFGVLLSGGGKVWADGFKFEVVDEKTPLTNMMGQSELPKQPVNLDFSE